MLFKCFMFDPIMGFVLSFIINDLIVFLYLSNIELANQPLLQALLLKLLFLVLLSL